MRSWRGSGRDSPAVALVSRLCILDCIADAGRCFARFPGGVAHPDDRDANQAVYGPDA